MSTDAVAPANGGISDYWMQRRNTLFLASCIALIVTAMSFAIRGDIITQLCLQFGLSKTQMGLVISTAFWGFTLAMIIGGPLCDILGMGRLMWLAVIGHTIGIFLTIFATGFWTLFLSTLAFGMGNGFVEAVANPLITTLYPDQKIKRLSLFHAWFPGGQVIGGLLAYSVTEAAVGQTWHTHAWQIKMLTMVVPLIIYAVMFMGKEFPSTEREASGVSSAEMYKAISQPMFLVFVFCMFLTASTELGPQQWFPNILTLTTGVQGILFLVWITGLMAVGRQFTGHIVEKISPVALLLISSILGLIGLFSLSQAQSAAPAFFGATIFALGVCFFWPTMLGTISERFPKTGAVGLAIMGGGGMLSSAIAQPIMGHTYDVVTAQVAGGAAKVAQYTAAAKATGHAAREWMVAQAAGGRATIEQVCILPIILIVIFSALYLYDRQHGGYHKVTLDQQQDPGPAPTA